MERTLVFLTLGLLLACNSTDTTNATANTKPVEQQSDTVVRNTGRQLLIAALQQLQAVLASKDKERIASLFPFPLPDTTVGIYIDDSAYITAFRKNGDQTTRAMFLDFFPQIAESLQVDEINQLFTYCKLDSLEQKDTLEHEVHISTEPCYSFYSIVVDHDLVTLSTGSGVNDNYKSLAPASDDEVPENSSEFCESVLWWVFRFDGKNLQLVKINGAG
jgi:hypothetical protein